MKPSARSRARSTALQALYQWQMSQGNILDIELQYLDRMDSAKTDVAYFQILLNKIPEQVSDIDARWIEFSNRPASEIDLISQSILRIATYELLYSDDVPFRVIINEALKLSKTFGSDEGYKFINGIVDKLAKAIREKEETE